MTTQTRPDPGAQTGPSSRATTSSAASDTSTRAQASDEGASASASDAFARAARQLAEIREYVGYFIAAKVDSVKLSVRNIVVYAALGVVALIAGVAAIAMAVIFVFVGLANAINALLGGSMWAGQLILGALVLLVIAIAIPMVISKLTKTSRTQTVEKYESRKRNQQARFGHDVADRARQADH